MKTWSRLTKTGSTTRHLKTCKHYTGTDKHGSSRAVISVSRSVVTAWASCPEPASFHQWTRRSALMTTRAGPIAIMHACHDGAELWATLAAMCSAAEVGVGIKIGVSYLCLIKKLEDAGNKRKRGLGNRCRSLAATLSVMEIQSPDIPLHPSINLELLEVLPLLSSNPKYPTSSS